MKNKWEYEPITISAPTEIHLKDKSVVLIATLNEGYESEGIVQWISLNTEIAEVDSNGKITPKLAGEVVINATIGKYKEYVIINIIE